MTFIAYAPPDELLKVLREKQHFWLATHVNPDGDGLGSLLGLGLALKAAGKDVRMIRHESGPSNFDELPGYDQTVQLGDVSDAPEVVVLFDCHHLARAGAMADRLSGNETVVVIDHHLTDGDEGGDGEIEWFVPQAAASACLVHSLVNAMDELHLDQDIATCLYAGLLTDTGGFRFSNTSREALAVGADLVGRGADAGWLAEIFIHRRRPQTLRLLARVLDTFDYRLGGRVVLARMTRAMCEETGARMEDTEGFVNFATSAEGVALVALIKEDTPTRWRVSLRANDPHDVQRVAAIFGGGGHAKAAGCTLEGSFEQLEARLLVELEAELERGAAGS